jgi:predicted DCC family thiol-disulfide oxidoreductase YuxK
MTTIEHPVILFDGVCNLCSGAVQFIVKRDPRGVLQFASLQSQYARQKLQDRGFDPEALYSIIVLYKGKILEKSDAVIEIAKHLSAPWRWFKIFRIVPRALRDAIYNVIARNRYRWFGKKNQCMIPTPALKARFVA